MQSSYIDTDFYNTFYILPSHRLLTLTLAAAVVASMKASSTACIQQMLAPQLI